MSDIGIKKELSDTIGGLNAEIGRLRILVSSTADELQDIEVKKAESIVAYNRESEEKALVLAKLSGDIDEKTKKINEIDGIFLAKEQEIQDSSSLLSGIAEREKSVADKETSFRQSVQDAEMLSKKLTVQKTEQEAREASISARENSIIENEAILENKKKALEESHKKSEIETDKAVKLQSSYEGKLADLERKESAVESRNAILDQREADIKEKERKLNEISIALDGRKIELGKQKASLHDRDQALITKEDDLTKRIALSGQKEAEVILRERDCRIREKSLSLREQEEKARIVNTP